MPKSERLCVPLPSPLAPISASPLPGIVSRAEAATILYREREKGKSNMRGERGCLVSTPRQQYRVIQAPLVERRKGGPLRCLPEPSEYKMYRSSMERWVEREREEGQTSMCDWDGSSSMNEVSIPRDRNRVMYSTSCTPSVAIRSKEEEEDREKRLSNTCSGGG